jgi:hypothetical protein
MPDDIVSQQGRHRMAVCLASVEAALQGVEVVDQLLAGGHRPTVRRYRAATSRVEPRGACLGRSLPPFLLP